MSETSGPFRGSNRRLLGAAAVLLLLAAGTWFVRAGRDHDPDASQLRAVRATLAPFLDDSPQRRHRVLVIGWDGATFNTIDPLLAAGRLPNLQRLLSSGSSMELESTIIPISSAAWTSACTGKFPPKTGIYSFFNPLPGSYDVELIDARSRRAAPIWNILNYRGLKTHVVGVPVTFPPEQIDGLMVSGMLASVNDAFATPPPLTDALRSLGFVPDLGIWRDRRQLDEETLVLQHDLKTGVLRTLLAGSDWDFSLLVFKCLDVLSHRLYRNDASGPVADHYARLDDALGQLIEAAGPDTDVLLVSDHGFGLYDYTLSIHGCLVQLGIAALADRPPAQVSNQGEPIAIGRAIDHRKEIARLDMTGTQAFCDSTEGHFAALRLNLRGREPQGVVEPGQRDQQIDRIARKLLSLRSGLDQSRVFTRLIRLDDLYPAPPNDLMPDIVLVADRRYLCRIHYDNPIISVLPAPRPEHELTGVLIAAGPSIRHQPARGRAGIADLTPTVLHLFSLPVFDTMDGRVLTEILLDDAGPELIGELPLPNWHNPDWAGPGPGREAIERMKALGYIQDTADR